MRTATIENWASGRCQDETVTIILGPDDNTDGWFLIQRADGTFWNFMGCPARGFFGGNPATWEASK